MNTCYANFVMGQIRCLCGSKFRKYSVKLSLQTTPSPEAKPHDLSLRPPSRDGQCIDKLYRLSS